MALVAGTHLGPYEVLGLIGAGAWGRSTRPATRAWAATSRSRSPADKLADPARRARFLQEARATSALSHPNIVTIHEVEAQGEIDFLVMEYVWAARSTRSSRVRGCGWVRSCGSPSRWRMRSRRRTPPGSFTAT